MAGTLPAIDVFGDKAAEACGKVARRGLCPCPKLFGTSISGPGGEPAGVADGRVGLDMKVTVERAALLKSIGHVHRVVERRNTIPILANLLIRAEKGKLGLKATDLDLEVVESIPAEVSPGGATTVPAHMIYDIVRKLPEGAQIVLDSSGDRASLTIRAGKSRFSLQTLPESDFPDLAAGEMTHKFSLPAKELKRLI